MTKVPLLASWLYQYNETRLEGIDLNTIALSSVIAKAPNDGAGLMVMKKAMDTAKQDGQNMVALLAASMPHLGQSIDIKA